MVILKVILMKPSQSCECRFPFSGGAGGALTTSPPGLWCCLYCVPIEGVGVAGSGGTSDAGHIAGQAASVVAVAVVVVKGMGVKNKTESTVHR